MRFHSREKLRSIELQKDFMVQKRKAPKGEGSSGEKRHEVHSFPAQKIYLQKK